MYYIVHKQENFIWTTIHLGVHDHPVMEGHLKKVFDQVKFMIEEEVSRTLGATALAITLVANKTFLSKHLLNKDGKGPVEVLKGNKLHQMMDKFLALFSPNV